MVEDRKKVRSLKQQFLAGGKFDFLDFFVAYTSFFSPAVLLTMSACVSLTWTAARIIPQLVVYNFESVLNQQFVGKFEFNLTFTPESLKPLIYSKSSPFRLLLLRHHCKCLLCIKFHVSMSRVHFIITHFLRRAVTHLDIGVSKPFP